MARQLVAGDLSASTDRHRVPIMRLGTVTLVAAVWVAMVLAHYHAANGPWYAYWWWHREPIWPQAPAMLLAAIPFAVAQWVGPVAKRFALGIALLVIGNVALQWTATWWQPHSPGRLRVEEVVDNGINTGYYSAAEVLYLQQEFNDLRPQDWLAGFPSLQEEGLMLHPRQKPPGLILYYMIWLKLFGLTKTARLAGAAVVGLLGALGVATTYLLMQRYGFDREAAFAGASFTALIPSLIVFFPQFDQAYVPFAALLVIGWQDALESDSARPAVAIGLAMGVVTFFTYMFLVLGLSMMIFTIFHLGDHRLAGLRRAIRQGVIAMAATAAFYLAWWIFTGFNPIAVYLTAARMCNAVNIHLGRPFPRHIFTDWLDLLRGTGWISVPLIVMGLWRLAKRRKPADPRWRLAVVGILQALTAIATAITPGESARLFMLLMPMLLVAAGYELSHWPHWPRLAVYAMLLLITIAMVQNMTFIYQPADTQRIEAWSQASSISHPARLPGDLIGTSLPLIPNS